MTDVNVRSRWVNLGRISILEVKRMGFFRSKTRFQTLDIPLKPGFEPHPWIFVLLLQKFYAPDVSMSRTSIRDSGKETVEQVLIGVGRKEVQQLIFYFPV